MAIRGPVSSMQISETKMHKERPEVCFEHGQHAKQYSWRGISKVVYNKGEIGMQATH